MPLHLLPASNEMLALSTLIRAANTPADAFIFYADRIFRLLIEFALEFAVYDDFACLDSFHEKGGV